MTEFKKAPVAEGDTAGGWLEENPLSLWHSEAGVPAGPDALLLYAVGAVLLVVILAGLVRYATHAPPPEPERRDRPADRRAG